MKTGKELVKDLKNGSAIAYDKLYSIYGIRIFQFALSLLKSREEAEEIVQGTYGSGYVSF